MKRLAWSEVRSARQPGLKQELRVLIELLRVLPRPGLPMHLTILPSNIMVGDDGSVLVGPARLEGASHQERYLAPEVQCGAEPMLPAGIYAVGALLFEAVTGHRFETRDVVTKELAGARAMARAAGLGGLFWEIYLLEAAAKATEEQPEARWGSGKDFAEDLERVARDRIVSRAELGQLVAEVAAERASGRPATRSSGPPETTSRTGPPPLPKRVRRRSSQSSKQKAVHAAAQPARGAPIPRTDGDAPPMPMIEALRVPSNLKVPEALPLAAPKSLSSNPPEPASSLPPAVDGGSSSSPPSTSSHPPARLSPVALGPRIEAEPVPAKASPNVAPVVVPSLAPPAADPGRGGESRRRTLTGTGDLRWLEALQPPADAMDPARHGTLLGLGNPAATAKLEPTFSDPEPATTPMLRPSPAPQYPSTSPAASSPPSNRANSPSSTPPSSRMRYVQSPALDSGWDARVGSDSDADTALIQRKSWMGRVVLAVVVLVALGIGTVEVVGHYAASDDKGTDGVAPKPAAHPGPTTEKVARASDESPKLAGEVEAVVVEAVPATSDDSAPAAEVDTAATEAPAAPAPQTAPARPAPPRPAPVRAAPPLPARSAPPKASERDYGI